MDYNILLKYIGVSMTKKTFVNKKYTVRKKSSKIQNIKNIYSWGGVKPIIRLNFNNI